MNTPISSFYDYFPGPALIPGMSPILGAGKLMEFEDDIQYMKQLYPGMCKKILQNIEERCDRLEYEGSMLFDSYPDKVTLERMAKEILAASQDEKHCHLRKPPCPNNHSPLSGDSLSAGTLPKPQTPVYVTKHSPENLPCHAHWVSQGSINLSVFYTLFANATFTKSLTGIGFANTYP